MRLWSRLPRTVRTLGTILGLVCGIAGASWVALDTTAWLAGRRPSNRFRIYALHTSLRLGMPAAEVERLLSTKDDPKVEHAWTRGHRELTVWVPLGVLRACYLHVKLEDGRVVQARVRGEEGASDRFADAPPDL